jgi:hypothetical protein
MYGLNRSMAHIICIILKSEKSPIFLTIKKHIELRFNINIIAQITLF